MAVFVLVSGAWSGSWAWRAVVPRLRRDGHDVRTLSPTGLAERAHVRSAEPITFSTHVQDVVDLLYFDDLVDVIMVGWSYGGAVADGVADLVPERLREVVNLDGEILREGHPLLDGWTEEAREHYGPTLRTARGTGWMPAPTEFVSIRDPELTQWVLQRVRPHPFGTYIEAYPDRGSRRHEVPHTYLRCGALDGEEPPVTELQSDPNWRFRELPTINHLGLLLAPDLIADALIVLASRSGRLRSH